MPTFRVSGTALPTAEAGDVASLDDALAGEEGVAVEEATRQDDGAVQFTLVVEAADAQSATEIGGRVADRLSPGSTVTVLG
ncbi:hypothetical protein [Cellulomonas sp.]|uniref:hypothetical protein n=1 Tax=Cellulomonas sp. TaxID=40001 RepID=UPI0028115E06|nr:hypothetical protein [Cellulomonas sp.]